MFHCFMNRAEITGVLLAETPLHIGAGQESFQPMATQGSQLKNARNRPFIPGSSLKGVMRSYLESIQKKKCFMGGYCTRDLKDKKGRDGRKEHIQQQKAVYEDMLEALFAEDTAANSCMACRLFGSQILAGKVKIADAALYNADSWPGFEFRTENAINRETHTTANGALHDIEVIPAGTEFSFRVIAENLTKIEAETLGNLLKSFSEGCIQVGGLSRSGLGCVSLGSMAVKITYRVQDYSLETYSNNVEGDIAKSLTEILRDKQAFAKEPQRQLVESQTNSQRVEGN